MIGGLIQFIQATLESVTNLVNSLLGIITDSLGEVINLLVQLLQSLIASSTSFLNGLIHIIGEV